MFLLISLVCWLRGGMVYVEMIWAELNEPGYQDVLYLTSVLAQDRHMVVLARRIGGRRLAHG